MAVIGVKERALGVGGGLLAVLAGVAMLCVAVRQPTPSDLHYLRGLTLEKLERRQEALAEYQRAARLNPRFYQALVNEGALLSGTAP